MHEVLVNRLGGLSLPRKSVVRLTDRPDMTLDVYRGRKTTIQHQITLPVFLVLEAELSRFLALFCDDGHTGETQPSTDFLFGFALVDKTGACLDKIRYQKESNLYLPHLIF